MAELLPATDLIRSAQLAKWIGAHAVGLAKKTATSHILFRVERAIGDAGRREIPLGAEHRVGDALGHQPMVFVIDRFGADVNGAHGGVRMRGGTENPIARQAAFALDNRLGGVKHLAADHAGVGDDNRQPCRAVVEHDGTRVQGIVNSGGRAVLANRTVERHTHLRRDVDLRGAGSQIGLGRRAGSRRAKEKDGRQQQTTNASRISHSLHPFI